MRTRPLTVTLMFQTLLFSLGSDLPLRPHSHSVLEEACAARGAEGLVKTNAQLLANCNTLHGRRARKYLMVVISAES